MADDLRVFYKIHVGSLSSAFATARHSRLAVKLAYGFALSIFISLDFVELKFPESFISLFNPIASRV